MESWEETAKAWIAFGTMLAAVVEEKHMRATLETIRRGDPRVAAILELGMEDMARKLEAFNNEKDNT